jgi:hypothetical protein
MRWTTTTEIAEAFFVSAVGGRPFLAENDHKAMGSFSFGALSSHACRVRKAPLLESGTNGLIGRGAIIFHSPNDLVKRRSLVAAL